MEVQIFNAPDGAQIRTVTGADGETRWVAKDVADALGYVWNGSARISHIPDEWKGITSVVTPFGVQEMAVLTEQGLYFFLGRSDKPMALPFQKWIAGEVLPAIRKTGSYSMANLSRLDLARMILEAEECSERRLQKIKTQAAKIAQDAPKVEYYENFQESHGNFAVSDVAKIMGYKPSEFFKILSEKKILFKRSGKWLPYQEFVTKGYFSVKVGTTEDNAWKQTCITPKGKTYIASVVPAGPYLFVPDPFDILAPQ